MKNKIKSVAVYCGHQSGGNPEYVRDAQRVGELLAYHKFTLVFGGGDVGLMGAVATAALNNGGKVIGVSTKCVISMQEPIHAGVETKITKGLSARKQKMYDISCFCCFARRNRNIRRNDGYNDETTSRRNM